MSRTLLFFAGLTGAYGIEPWVTDGTLGGTALLADAVPGPGSSSPGGFVSSRAGVLFSANDGSPGIAGLFVTNGTAATTTEVKNDFPALRVTVGHDTGTVSSLGNLTAIGDGRVVFTGSLSNNLRELFVTDGTLAGTVPLVQFGPTSGVLLYGFRALGNGRVVFAASLTSQSGLWSTDGTAAGTVRLAEAASAGTSTVFDGKALFTKARPFSGADLGATDGTVAGTALVLPADGSQAGPPASSSKLPFVYGAGDALGNQLWSTDGTAAGTTVLAGHPASAIDPNGFDPSNVTRLSTGRYLFAANNGVSGTARTSLWLTDGTAPGTTEIADFFLGGGVGNGIGTITPLSNGKAIVQVQDSVARTTTLYATDGTAAGTAGLVTLPTYNRDVPTVLVAALPNGKAVFNGFDRGGTAFLYVTDGTAAGTTQFLQLPPNLYLYTTSAISALTGGNVTAGFSVLPDGRAVFQLRDTGTGTVTLFATSGTAASTVPLGTVGIYATPVVAVVPDTDPLFDTDYYLFNNPDVAASPIGATQHYLQFGAAEGRNPDAFFDSRYYLGQNPDVKAAGVNPLAHFEQFGWQEGRDPGTLFSVSKYLTAYQDVAAAHVDPLAHYIQFGQAEGRTAFPSGGPAPAPLVQAASYDPQPGPTTDVFLNTY